MDWEISSEGTAEQVRRDVAITSASGDPQAETVKAMILRALDNMRHHRVTVNASMAHADQGSRLSVSIEAVLANPGAADQPISQWADTPDTEEQEER